MKNIYEGALGSLRNSYKEKQRLRERVKQQKDRLESAQKESEILTDAQRVLSAISDEGTESVLSFITGVVNKALSEIFPDDAMRIYLSKRLYGSRPHINIKLVDGAEVELDINTQTGTGIKQVISFLFQISLIEIRKGRRLIMIDERLSGLHKEAKRILSEIIQIFTRGGFQFIIVEYALNDLGKVYNIEKVEGESKLYSLDGDDYDDSKVFMFSNVDLSILDNDFVDDEEELEAQGAEVIID